MVGVIPINHRAPQTNSTRPSASGRVSNSPGIAIGSRAYSGPGIAMGPLQQNCLVTKVLLDYFGTVPEVAGLLERPLGLINESIDLGNQLSLQNILGLDLIHSSIDVTIQHCTYWLRDPIQFIIFSCESTL